MDRRSSDRTPVSSLILLSSVVFTITTYLVFNALWGVNIHVRLLVAVLGLQFTAFLLGSSKVLTQLGAASLAALIAVAACIGAVFMAFPPLPAVRIAGAVGGGSALIFILSSLVAASSGDPAVPGDSEPLFIEEFDGDHTVELIKYGEIRDPDILDAHAPLSSLVQGENGVHGSDPDAIDAQLPTFLEDMAYEFDEPSGDGLDLIAASEIPAPGPGPQDLEDENLFEQYGEPGSMHQEWEPPSGSEASPESDTPDSWLEETSWAMSNGLPRDKTVERHEDSPGKKIDVESVPSAAKGFPDFRMRSRYKVLDAASGEHYGTYYGDEGYSTLDPVSLSGLINEKIKPGELRIVKLDWSNFDEVEVHIEVHEEAPIRLDESMEVRTIDQDTLQGGGAWQEVGPLPGSQEAAQTEVPAGGPGLEGTVPVFGSTSPRYMIYDRRTIQPMGEYKPEGDRSRIDRLVLYKMFPEYDFKTFEIDSIRWENDEVRILVRGEKKSPKSRVQVPEGPGSPKPKVPSPKGKNRDS